MMSAELRRRRAMDARATRPGRGEAAKTFGTWALRGSVGSKGRLGTHRSHGGRRRHGTPRNGSRRERDL